MKFYMTTEPCQKIRNVFNNLSSFYVVNIDELLSESGLDMSKPSHSYLLNSEIKRLLLTGVKSKRYAGIIYINSSLDCDNIISIKHTVTELENSTVDDFVALDDYDLPKLKKYHKLFDEVIFFNTIKKKRILQCTPKKLKGF